MGPIDTVVDAIGANLRAFGDAALDTIDDAIGAAIDAIRDGLTRDAIVASLNPLNALLALGLRAFDTLRALDPAFGAPLDLSALDALRPFDAALDLRTLDPLRTFDAAFGALLNLLALGALRPFSAGALFTAALNFGRAFALIVIIALSAGRGRNRQCGNAGGEKYPGHDEILLLKAVERPAGRGVPGSTLKEGHFGVLG